MEFFQTVYYDNESQIKIKDIILENVVLNKVERSECDSGVYGVYDFYTGPHNNLNRKRKSHDVLPFYTAPIKSEQSDRNLGWEESKTTNEDMRQKWFSDKYQGSRPRLGRKKYLN